MKNKATKKKHYKTSFVVTITTDGEVKQKALAYAIRDEMKDQEFVDPKGNIICVTKVTVSPVGEK